MVEISKEVFLIFCHINCHTKETSLFQLKRTYKAFLLAGKFLICGLDYFRHKCLISRALYHLPIIVKIYLRKQVGMGAYHSGNCIG